MFSDQFLADLRQTIRTAVADAIAESLHDSDSQSRSPATPTQLQYCEAEAAQLLGMRKHQLRDARLDGLIAGYLVRGRIYYAADELRRFCREMQGNEV
jgi:hypothetical protein